MSGLDGDYNRNIFGQIIKLIPICDTVDKLTAYCSKCNNGTIAPFTKKYNSTGGIGSSTMNNTNTQIFDIGGIDKYLPVCRHLYLN